MVKSAKYILAGNGIYYVVTGIWPVIHLESFMMVTGYKTDTWLAGTFGLLLFVIGLVFLKSSGEEKVSDNMSLISGAVTTTLALADIYYYLKGSTGSAYLADAAIQLAFASAWVVAGLRAEKRTIV